MVSERYIRPDDQRLSYGWWAAIAVLLGMVVVRGVPHLLFPEAFFDSDQAIIGIMAKDVVTGRAFPWTFYGQKYLLAIEAWVVAGSFALFGVSLWSLKLPLLLINGLVAGVMFSILRRDVRFTSGESLALASLVALPSFVEGSYLMAAQGGNVWPLLYVLVAWLLRTRPVSLGFFLGLTYFQREFVVFSLVSLACLDLLMMRGASLRATLKSRLLTLLVAFATYHSLIGIGQLNPEFIGPGSPKMPLRGPQVVLDNVIFFLKAHAPALFGLGVAESVRPFDISSDVLTAPSLWGALNALGVFGVLVWAAWSVPVRGLIGKERDQETTWHFLLYLALVGAGQIAAYLLFVSSQEHVLIRYLVMAPYLLVGLVGIALYTAKDSRKALLKFCTMGVIVSLGAANLTQSVAFYMEQSSHGLATQRRQLAQYLMDHDYHLGWAPYWEAYYLTFISDEKLIVASSDHTRVRRYKETLVAHPEGAFVLTHQGQCDDSQAPVVEGWQICPLHRYKGEIVALTKGA